MQENIKILKEEELWARLNETPYPPKRLYIRSEMRGGFAAPHHKLVTIVGSRHCSDYGKQVVDEICKSLSGQPATIISGLASGIDAHAHKCALKYNLHTIAVLGCGLGEQVLRTHSNYRLAHKILDAGGALISEYEHNQTSRPYMFPARNRIMVGLADLVIIIEAREKSGTLITARMATDYNRDLLVIPNSIYSQYSKGSNELIKQGAYVYTKPEDIFNLLKLDYNQSQTQLQSGALSSYTPTQLEQQIINTLHTNSKTTQEILELFSSTATVSEIVQSLLNLEIEDVVKRVNGRYVIL